MQEHLMMQILVYLFNKTNKATNTTTALWAGTNEAYCMLTPMKTATVWKFGAITITKKVLAVRLNTLT